MLSTGHASHNYLAAYADGSLPEGMSLLVAGHLTYCPACRTAVARYEAIGGGLLCSEAAAEPGAACLDRALAQIDAPPAGTRVQVAPRRASCPDDAVLPAPIRERLPVPFTALRWRFRMPGMSDYRMPGFAGEDVSLLRARPGVRIPSHTHQGEEATLVLAGQLRDGGRIYARGEVALADHEDEHRPEIVGDEVCICLAVVSGRMRFTGPMGAVLNLLNG